MMGTHRPVMSEREDLSPRQTCWWNDTNGRTRPTSGYERTRSAPIPIDTRDKFLLLLNSPNLA
jgi:hypothetical protein